MQYRSVKGFTGAGQLGILLLMLGLGMMLTAGIQTWIALQVTPKGLPLAEAGQAAMKALLLPENVFYARLSQVLGSFFILFLPAVLYVLICYGKNSFWLGFNTQLNYKQVLIGFLLIFFAGLIASPLAELSKYIAGYLPSLDRQAKLMEKAYTDQVVAMSNLKGWGEFFIALVIMVFLPSLFEEVFFRGALQQLLERWWRRPFLAIIVTSLIFSFIHLSVYLFLSRAVLGFVLGLMFHKSKNIWVNIMAHFLNNAVALLQLFWVANHKVDTQLTAMEKNIQVWGGVFAALATYGLFYLFEKVSAKNRTQVAFKEQNLLEQQGNQSLT